MLLITGGAIAPSFLGSKSMVLYNDMEQNFTELLLLVVLVVLLLSPTDCYARVLKGAEAIVHFSDRLNYISRQ
jgi:hypothetical protein